MEKIGFLPPGRRIVLALILLWSTSGEVEAIFASNTSCLDNAFFTDVNATYDIIYGSAFNNKTGLMEDLKMDKYEPLNAPPAARPVGVFIHGGNCIGGDKSNAAQVRWARWFAQRGFVTVSINYRLQSILPSCRTPGSIEAAGSDAKAAIRYIQARADEWGINKNQVLISGCSAGARTSMWAAYAAGNGVTNDLVDTSPNDPDENAVVTAVAEVSGDLYAPNEIPPIIDPGDPPVLIMHGTADANAATPIEAAYEVEGNATASFVYSELMIYNGAGHCPYSSIEQHMTQVFAFARTHLQIDCAAIGGSAPPPTPAPSPAPSPAPIVSPSSTPAPTAAPATTNTPAPTSCTIFSSVTHTFGEVYNGFLQRLAHIIP